MKYIEKNKIILAIEIKDLVVRYTDKPTSGYLPLNVNTFTSKFQAFRRKIFNLGHYYKPMFAVHKIKDLITGLASISRVSLILYTSL